MRILVFDYGLCNFHNLISLVEDGHRVYVIGTMKEPPRKFFDSLGIKILVGDNASRESYMMRWIEESDIDLAIFTSPRNTDFRGSVAKRVKKVIGLNNDSARLEKNKLFVRQEAEKLGINVPKLLDTPQFPCVVKPSDIYPVWWYKQKENSKVIDYAQICYTEEEYLKVIGDYDYFVEEFIPDNIETNVAYAISGGKWSIMHTQQVIGEDLAKLAGKFTHWTKTVKFAKLSEENEKLALDNAEIFLNWASQFGGDYVGQITGLIKDGKWYFCENNVRPEQTNSLPYFISGNQWLEGMMGNPSIIGDGFPNHVHKMVVQPNEPDSIYPFHLHEKYGVAIPCGLDILRGEYRVAMSMRPRAPDKRIGIIICDREIPQGFIDEFEKSSEFSVSHCFN